MSMHATMETNDNTAAEKAPEENDGDDWPDPHHGPRAAHHEDDDTSAQEIACQPSNYSGELDAASACDLEGPDQESSTLKEEERDHQSMHEKPNSHMEASLQEDQSSSRRSEDSESIDFTMEDYPLPSPSGNLDVLLSVSPIPEETKNAIITNLWKQNNNSPLSCNDLDWDAFWNFYTRTCLSEIENATEKALDGATHSDLVKVARQFEVGGRWILNTSDLFCTRAYVRRRLDLKTPSITRDKVALKTMSSREFIPCLCNGAREDLIRVTTWIYTMMNYRPEPFYRNLADTDLQTYYRSVPDSVYLAMPQLRYSHITLDKYFTARYIDHDAGIKVIWSDDLLKHLLLFDSDTKLFVFHHASFLKYQHSLRNPVFPAGLIEEALDTLALLFPESDTRIQEWFRHIVSTAPGALSLDRQLVRCGDLRPGRRHLKHFRHWRDNLVVLKELVDQSAPASGTLRRLLKDRRKGDQWFNSWVAVVVIGVTLFFGLIQSIEGAIQVYKSYHPGPK